MTDCSPEPKIRVPRIETEDLAVIQQLLIECPSSARKDVGHLSPLDTPIVESRGIDPSHDTHISVD